MKEDTIMVKKHIIDNINSNKLKVHIRETNKDLSKSVKSTWSNWELGREEKEQYQKKKKKKKKDIEYQKTRISKDKEKVKEKCDSLKKAVNIMESEFG